VSRVEQCLPPGMSVARHDMKQCRAASPAGLLGIVLSLSLSLSPSLSLGRMLLLRLIQFKEFKESKKKKKTHNKKYM
jgi:hypothetical protein